MSRPPLPEDGRVRRRVEGMRRVQDAALSLFEKHGYSAVSVEQIAEAAEVGVATVYRSFGTKERTVLWDEYDPLLLEGIAERLRTEPLLPAVTGGLLAAIEQVYTRDKRRILRRSRLLLSEPALLAASAVDARALRTALAELFVQTRASPNELHASVAAAAILATLEVAVARWVELHGRTPMQDLLREALASLATLASPV